MFSNVMFLREKTARKKLRVREKTCACGEQQGGDSVAACYQRESKSSRGAVSRLKEYLDMIHDDVDLIGGCRAAKNPQFSS